MSRSNHHEHPFQQGFTAFKTGVDLKMITLTETCPYRAGTESCTQFIAGYYMAASGLNYTGDNDA